MCKKGTSNIEVRKANRNQIFRYINKNGRVSRPEIVAALKISMPTVLQNVNDLIEKGLVQEVGEFKSTGGRKAIAISPVQNAKYAIGIDITSNHIGLVLTDLSGQVIEHVRVYQPYTNELAYYDRLSQIALDFKEECDISDEVFLGFGISIPAIVDPTSRRILFSHALGISNVACEIFTQGISYSAIFINDASASAVAEMYDTEERSKAVYVSLSNSVGGAIIDDGFYEGDNWRSAEFGHVTLIPKGKRCYCGKEGCFDSYCSAISLAKHTDGKLEGFFKELKSGNENLQKRWEDYLSYLAIQINNLRMIFDCRVIIGGYVGSFIEPYMGQFKENLAKLNTFEEDASYVQACRYKVEAAALGAALKQVELFIGSI